MIVGTMSDVGKSIITAGLCRYFTREGYSVAPFKSQNMALNSYVTSDGGEMGRAQAMQALAAGKEPDWRMNPVLLKPVSDVGSEVIVNGQTEGNMPAREYFEFKKTLIPRIMESYESLAAENDIIIIEGAGSPAEINLRENDIVNMGFAEMVDAPVLLVGDIDRGGVFAQLYGTISLLEDDERQRIRGLVINKFRGDVSLLEPGLRQIEEKTGISVLGVMPYMQLNLPAEDSLADILNKRTNESDIDIAIIRLPHISNFNDFDPLREHPSLDIRYVYEASELKEPDLIIVPGTRSTISDMKWLEDKGLAQAITEYAKAGGEVIGVCGGYQILGESIADPDGVEGDPCEVRGLGLLPVHTVFSKEKYRAQTKGRFIAGPMTGAKVSGYEIHMGRTEVSGQPVVEVERGTATTENDVITAQNDASAIEKDMSTAETPILSDKYDGCHAGNITGTYLHGLFDDETAVDTLAEYLCKRKGIEIRSRDAKSAKSDPYELLADAIEKSLDMIAIKGIMGL